MKCDHCGVKRFVCLMYNCTDLNICAFCSSDKLSTSSLMSFITALPSCVLVLSSGLTTKFNVLRDFTVGECLLSR